MFDLVFAYPKYVRALGAGGHISVPHALEKKETRQRERSGSSSDRLREPRGLPGAVRLVEHVKILCPKP